jgi:hypothetical protein
MVDLSVDFDDKINENKIIIYALCEGKPMEQVVRMRWMKRIFCNQTLVML